MNRRNALLALAVLLAFLGVTAGAMSPTAVTPAAESPFACCDAPTRPRGCCPERPPDGAADPQPAGVGGFTCPLTGEQLPCPGCCPLNQRTPGTGETSVRGPSGSGATKRPAEA